jgi:hypothetical protein
MKSLLLLTGERPARSFSTSHQSRERPKASWGAQATNGHRQVRSRVRRPLSRSPGSATAAHFTRSESNLHRDR